MFFAASWSPASDTWECQVPFFVEQGYRCVLLDRRGHGRTDRPKCGHGLFATHIDQFNADLLEFMKG
ncbi:alpha/beta fold hydrolase [Nonomuraea sp. B12E4]|uniref:alpha/beta fold hydrolase n=1 Tax=Nonomuraea sp. B12E4 TaxID=3153564 RepID=UPI00325CB676